MILGIDNISDSGKQYSTDKPIPCLEFEEIHPTDDQIAQSPDQIKHGIIIFAGGQVILHLKQDVLIDNLVEDEIKRRLADSATSRTRGQDTDLIPGVYEGNHNKNGKARSPQRPLLYSFDRNHDKRHLNNNATKNHRNDRYFCNIESSSSSAAPSYRSRRDSRYHDDNANFHSSRYRRDETTPTKPNTTNTKHSQRSRRNELRHPWFNQEMAALIGLREKAHRKWAASKQRRKGDANWEAFKKCRSAVSTLRRVRRNDYLVAALQVDAFASAQPWQTKGIAKSASLEPYPTTQSTF